MSENLITQSELESFAPNLDLSAFSATTTSGLIAQASEHVKRYCQVEGFFKAAVTNEREKVNIGPNGDLVISFRRRPVADGDIDAIRLVTVDVSQSLTLENNAGRVYFIPNPGTYVTYPSNFLISHGTGLIGLDNANLFYEIDYTGGYATDIADIPADLKRATVLVARSIISKDFNPAGASSFTQGAISMNFGGNKGGRDQLMQEAENVLNAGGYVRKVIF